MRGAALEVVVQCSLEPVHPLIRGGESQLPQCVAGPVHEVLGGVRIELVEQLAATEVYAVAIGQRCLGPGVALQPAILVPEDNVRPLPTFGMSDCIPHGFEVFDGL